MWTLWCKNSNCRREAARGRKIVCTQLSVNKPDKNWTSSELKLCVSAPWRWRVWPSWPLRSQLDRSRCPKVRVRVRSDRWTETTFLWLFVFYVDFTAVFTLFYFYFTFDTFFFYCNLVSTLLIYFNLFFMFLFYVVLRFSFNRLQFSFYTYTNLFSPLF